MVHGTEYTITTPGTTDFTLYGALDNEIGTIFTYNGELVLGDGTIENDFSVLIKITLRDDLAATDNLFNTNITCDYGYHTAATTDPYPNINLFQTDSHIYKFIQRIPPAITVYQDWAIVADLEDENNYMVNDYVENDYVDGYAEFENDYMVNEYTEDDYVG
jgi:hypothetical protein